MSNEITVFPYTIKEGIISEVGIARGEEIILKVPLLSGVSSVGKDLSVLSMVDWSKIKQESSNFRKEHKNRVINKLNKTQKRILKYIYVNRNIDYSLKRLSSELKTVSSQISRDVSVLSLVGVIDTRRSKRNIVASISSFGLEVCLSIFGEQKYDDGRNSLLESIK